MHCLRCGTANPPRSKFCNECGAVLESPKVSPAQAERRQLTVLFCDLVGSTVLSGQLDPEDLRELVRAYQEVCSTIIRRYEGHIAQFLGDGLLIYFGFPMAHEDDARRAVSAALDILDAMSQPLYGRRMQVRIGIHTGLVVVGEMGGEGHREQLALGETPNIAARVQGEAVPDSLVISEATQRLCRGFFELEPLGRKTLKGVAQPVPLYRVLRASGAVTRLNQATMSGLTPFVGREAELKVILRSLAEADQGHGRLVMLCGEPGIGKSRLLEVIKHRQEARQFELLECQCSPLHSNSALYPIIEMLARQLDLKGVKSPQERLLRLEEGLSRTAPHPPETIPLLASLLGIPYEHRHPRLELPPGEQRVRTLEFLQEWWLKMAARRPLLFLLEDLHWADATTLELLRRLVERELPAKFLGLVTFRPEFRLPWAPAAHMAELMLHPLPPGEVERMVLHVASLKQLPEAVQTQIITRAGGIPLFVEELTKAVLETGLLAELADRYELRGPMPEGLLPATVQDSLMARLDRLDTARPVAQLAATLGREFPYEVLQAVSNMDDSSLQRELGWLIDAGLLFKQGMPPRVRYVFKHALIRDTAYESLLRKTRQQYHRQIVDALRTRFPEIAEAEPDVMAVHCEGAGLTWEAILEWQRAGERALASAAFHECVAHFERTSGLLKPLPESLERDRKEFAIQLSLGAAFNAMKGWADPSVDAAYVRALELCQRTGDSARMTTILCGRWSFFAVSGNHRRSVEIMEQLRGLAETTTDDGFARAVADSTAVGTYCLSGDYTRAAQLALQAESYLDLERDRVVIRQIQTSSFVGLFGYGLVADWAQGRASRANTILLKVLEHCRQLDHGMTTALGLWFACILAFLQRQREQALSHAEAMRQASEKDKLAFWLIVPPVYRGWARIQQGQEVERGLEELLGGLSDYRKFVPDGCALGHFFSVAVDGLYTAGRFDQALSVVEEGLAHRERTNWRFMEVELLRQKGEVLLRLGGEARRQEAEDFLHRSVQCARELKAPLLELRSAMSLGTAWASQGRHREALELLELAYKALPEAGDLRDIREARAFLEELRTAASGTAVRVRES